MTAEERLDRLERIAKLFARAGLRERRSRKSLEEKLDIIVTYQIDNEERFQRNEERFQRNEERFQRNEERFQRNEERFQRNEERFEKLAETVAQLAEAQTRTEKRLDSLIEAIQRDRNGSHH